MKLPKFIQNRLNAARFITNYIKHEKQLGEASLLFNPPVGYIHISYIQYKTGYIGTINIRLSTDDILKISKIWKNGNEAHILKKFNNGLLTLIQLRKGWEPSRINPFKTMIYTHGVMVYNYGGDMPDNVVATMNHTDMLKFTEHFNPTNMKNAITVHDKIIDICNETELLEGIAIVDCSILENTNEKQEK